MLLPWILCVVLTIALIAVIIKNIMLKKSMIEIYRNGNITFSNTAHKLNTVTVGRLFDRFYTVEASRNSTGLGLSIAKLLIERMGGTISAQYADNKLNIVIKI